MYRKGRNTDIEGTVYLPDKDWNHFCEEKLLPCKNHCSGNGICYGNKCHCLPGLAGEDCSIKCNKNDYVYEGKCVK